MRWARFSIALTLTVAVAGLPLVLDQCSTICAAAAVAKANATSPDPTCGRTTTVLTHVDGAPAPCGHDHTGIDRATVGDTPQARTLTVPLVAVVTTVRVVAPGLTVQTRDHHPTHPPNAITNALGSPLRI